MVENILFRSDNLTILKHIANGSIPNLKGKIKLIYIDPPFATNRTWTSKNGEHGYHDKFTLDEFIAFLKERLTLMRDILAENGSIFVHLDHRTSHYVKILLDDIFGRENFRNEIIWNYISGGITEKAFARKHDTIFFYTKSNDYTFYPQKERRKDYPLKKIQKDNKGEFVWYIRPHTNPSVPNGVKTYIDKYVQDVWTIPIVNPMATERVDYPTQKPEALLERIILATTDEGDIVADFFAGSGTTGVVADRLNRTWILVDSGDHAIATVKKRLKASQHRFIAIDYQKEGTRI